MGLVSSIQKTGTDFSRYTPKGISSTGAIPAPTTDFQSLLSVTGEGYLSCCHYAPDSSGQLKVTIDGVVTYLGKGSFPNFLGLVNGPLAGSGSSGLLFAKAGIDNYRIQSSGTSLMIEYPTTVASTQYCYISQPIYYKNSLDVEVKEPSSDGPGNYRYTIAYGVIL